MSDSTEVLIENVKKHKILYDLSHPDYKNVRIKNKVWDEMANDMGLKHTGDDLKKRWKNLRDCFSKYLRSEKTRTGQAAKSKCRYKTWPWAQHMETFRPSLQFATTDSNILDTDIAETAEVVREETEVSSEQNEATETAENLQSETNTIDERSSTKITYIRDRKQEKKRKSIEDPTSNNSSSVEKVINFLDKRHSSVNNHSDAIDLVFQGYAASVKKLPPRSQATIKYKIAKIIMKEELAQLKGTLEQSQPGTSLTFNSTASSEASNMAASQHKSTSSYFNSSDPCSIRATTDGGSLENCHQLQQVNSRQLQQIEVNESSLELEHCQQSQPDVTWYGDLCRNTM